MIRTAPQSGADLESESWREKSYCFQSIMAAEQRNLPESQKKDFEYSAGFLIGEFPFMADKTRSSIVATATGVLDVFMRGAARDLFSTETTFIPEMSRFGGAIIVLDLSVKEFGEVGRFAQTLFKLIWQQAMERTNTVQNRRPVFLFADEFQEFCVSEDRDFQATARSSLCCTVYATQNLPSLYAAMGGGESAKQQADALIGNLSTRILHANGDQTTNAWCAEMIAKSWQYRMSFGSGSSPSREVSMIKNQTDRSVNSTVNEQLDYDVQPQEFTTLQMAGPPNWASEAIVFQAGRRWALTGKNFLRVLFPQGVS
ncbi:MAG: TraM recognition domain-containing protein, partial [Schlesneria sp.]